MSQSIDFSKIKSLRTEIDRLLAQRPEFQPFQDRINEELRKAGKNINNRSSALSGLALELNQQLHTALNDLRIQITKHSELVESIKSAEPIKKEEV